MTKIDVISGFLGAGKTTFIRKLLEEALSGEKIVLIENEFGEISIDGGFMKDAGIEVREMSQGCICCSLVGDFEKSLREVIERFDADRIIIEPSGVGKLSDVMKAVTKASVSLDVVLNSSVTIVDAKKVKLYSKNFGEFFANQIQYAGTVVLSRTDTADEGTVEEAVSYIRSLNPSAEIVSTPISMLTGERLLEIIEKRDDTLEEMRILALHEPDGETEEEHHHHHHHHEHDDDDEDEDDDHEHHHHHHHHHGHDADEIFDSIGFENVPAISEAALTAALSKLSGEGFENILRAKGILKASDSDSWYYFDMVPGEFEIRKGSPDYAGRLTVIGSEPDRDIIGKLFLG